MSDWSGTAADADAWWAEQPESRRIQVHRWLTERQGSSHPVPGQLTLTDTAQEDTQ